MINIQQLSLSVHHNEEDLVRKISKSVRQKHFSYQIRRKSIDARNKENIRYIYNIDVFTGGEQYRPSYRLPENGKEILAGRPVIVGFGPAGIFCALMLARKGMRPLVLEKGKPADRREMTEVCFGEGGAGTFSDGKLNTLVKDDSGRNEEVLRTFVAHGADEEILFEQKPHIGTDRLIGIITSIRKEIIRLGGEVRFETEMTDFAVEDGRLVSLTLSTGEVIPASAAVLASGHSARDTFALLKAR